MLLGFGGTFCGYEKQTVVGITVFLDSHFRKYLQCRILQVSLPKYLESPYLSSFPLPLPLSKKDTRSSLRMASNLPQLIPLPPFLLRADPKSREDSGSLSSPTRIHNLITSRIYLLKKILAWDSGKLFAFSGFQGRPMTCIYMGLLFDAEVSLRLGICILGHINWNLELSSGELTPPPTKKLRRQ